MSMCTRRWIWLPRLHERYRDQATANQPSRTASALVRVVDTFVHPPITDISWRGSECS
jgi:hypothetical protein